MNIKMFCTVLGIFIAKIKEETETKFILEDPKLISADHGGTMALVPFPPFCEDSVIILNKTGLVCEPYDCIEELKQEYIKAVSGIEVASPKSTISEVKTDASGPIIFPKKGTA